MDYPILSQITSPQDLSGMTAAQLQQLCAEIRSCIVDTVSKNGGHLASNLGAVELTVALHRSFRAPQDAILFDVGHQCYTHKLLTGRFDRFATLRQADGLSGFMRPEESPYDAFVSGHSSNSISAAYGIYKAKQLSGQSGTAVAVIGDGAMTGGMAYEALNNIGHSDANFIVVLNDNKMSISRNVGAVARGLTHMRNRPRYHRFKEKTAAVLLKIPLVGKGLYRALEKVKNGIKGLVYRDNLFSAMGLNYLGPVDGHNIEEMEDLFRVAQKYNRPCLIHVVTTKGKGYAFAENKPKNYHGVAPFNSSVGVDVSGKMSYSEVAGQTLCELAKEQMNLCALTAAMTEGTGLAEFAQKYRTRFFDVGIAEEHALTFSCGLASAGMIPFFAVYSSFLQRAYDQVIHDAAIAHLPLKLLVDRAGVVGEDGESHQGLFDVAFLTTVPDMTVYSPATYDELRLRITETAKNRDLCAIRYPRGGQPECDERFDGDFTLKKNGGKKLLITYGRLYFEAEKAAAGKADILKLNRIWPLPDGLADILGHYSEIRFFEEGIRAGGIGEHLGARLLENGFAGKYVLHAVDNRFVPAADTATALARLKLDAAAMRQALGEEKHD